MTHLNNTLTKTFTSGATAMAILAGVGMTAAPQAEAAQLTCTASAPCMLSDFVGTDNFFVTGDKQFADFLYIPTEGNVPTADNIEVFGEKIGKVINIVFNGLFLAEEGERAEAFLSHTTTILKPNTFFKEFDLSFNGQGPFAGITETVFDTNNPFPVPIAQLDVDTDNPPSSLFDIVDVSDLKLTSVRAEKDIELFGSGGSASISIFRQSYTQDVPEPASMLGLLAVGGLGLVLKRKQAN
ncbi:MAG: PEP-CTERM sorting domain-containing protein [Cyanobacteriota bacterium]|nr:PEP-CTERM sorting domain-containing protein [Cyanobacteriota bacterium]